MYIEKENWRKTRIQTIVTIEDMETKSVCFDMDFITWMNLFKAWYLFANVNEFPACDIVYNNADFNREEFEKAIDIFNTRDRRMGGNSKK